MKVFILTEGGKNIGFGHITRCISLYDAFKDEGVIPNMIVSGDSLVKELLGKREYRIFNWASKIDNLRKIVRDAAIVIIDSYIADLSLYNEISKLVKTAVYIDDNKRLNYPKGIVVNITPYAKEKDYLRKDGHFYLLGTRYLPLRKEFWQVSQKKIRKDIENILITFGGNDPEGMTLKILKLLRMRYPELRLKVVLGRGFKDIKKIEKFRDDYIKFIYSPDAKTMKEAMLGCDVSISAGGQTLFELARVGVPTIAFGVARNQINNLKDLEKAKVIKYAGWHDNKDLALCLSRNLSKLFSYSTRIAMSKQGRRLVDGKGARNIAEKIVYFAMRIKPQYSDISLRKIKQDDCYDIWRWRNASSIRKWSFDNKKIDYQTHREWFKEKIRSRNAKIYIAEDIKRRKIGQIRFEIKEGHNAYVNINLKPKSIGKGFGSRVIALGTAAFLREKPGVKKVFAEIIEGNAISKKAFKNSKYVFLKNISKIRQRTDIFVFKNDKKNI